MAIGAKGDLMANAAEVGYLGRDKGVPLVPVAAMDEGTYRFVANNCIIGMARCAAGLFRQLNRMGLGYSYLCCKGRSPLTDKKEQNRQDHPGQDYLLFLFHLYPPPE